MNDETTIYDMIFGVEQRSFVIIWGMAVLTAVIFGTGGFLLGIRTANNYTSPAYTVETNPKPSLQPIETYDYAQKVFDDIRALDTTIAWTQSEINSVKQIQTQYTNKEQFVPLTNYLVAGGWWFDQDNSGDATIKSLATWRKSVQNKELVLKFLVEYGLVTISVSE